VGGKAGQGGREVLQGQNLEEETLGQTHSRASRPCCLHPTGLISYAPEGSIDCPFTATRSTVTGRGHSVDRSLRR
jgi:hypothetical protein